MIDYMEYTKMCRSNGIFPLNEYSDWKIHCNEIIKMESLVVSEASKPNTYEVFDPRDGVSVSVYAPNVNAAKVKALKLL